MAARITRLIAVWALAVAAESAEPAISPISSGEPAARTEQKAEPPILRDVFQAQFNTEQLARFKGKPDLEQLVRAMTFDQRAGARAQLAEAEAAAGTPEDLKEIARGYLMLDEHSPNPGGRAVFVAEKVREMEPGNSDGFTLAARAYHQMGDYPSAAQWAKDALKRNPDDEAAKAVLLLSVGRSRRGELGVDDAPPSAAETREGALPSGDWRIPEAGVSPQALTLMREAVAARRAGNMPKTMELAQAAMNADPTSTGVQNFYRFVEGENGKHADTKEYLRLSKEALDAGRGADAVAWAEKAAERSKDPTVYKILELTRQRGGKLPQAAVAGNKEKPPTKGGFPLWPVGVSLGLMAFGYGVARSKATWAEQEVEAPEGEDPNSERIQRNRFKLRVAVAAAAIGFGVVYAGPIIVRSAAPIVAAAWRNGNTSFQRIAASQTGAVIIGGTGTVWDSIKATGPLIQGTHIPKSFEIMVNGRLLIVNANATKHFPQHLGRFGGVVSPTTSQAFLTSFQSALQKATAGGLPKFDQKVTIDGWEIILSQWPTQANPVVKHAVYLGQ